MILVDTSAWVEFDRATNSKVDKTLTALIRSEPNSIAVTEPIVMEVLAGAKSARRHNDLRRLMHTFGLIPFDVVADFEGAARIYQQCRSSGITPRGLIDCMIMQVAVRTGAALLTTDRDFDQLTRLFPLRLHPHVAGRRPSST